MKRRNIISMILILVLLLGACGREASHMDEVITKCSSPNIKGCRRTASHMDEVCAEEPIYYSSWLNGRWQSVEVMVYGSAWNNICESPKEADGLVGTIYDFTGISGQNTTGGVVPIRNIEEQVFFRGTGRLSNLELSGNYYTMFEIDPCIDTCFIIKNREEWLVWEGGSGEHGVYGVYRLQKIEDTAAQEHAYDENLSFEDNIRIRMEEQGIQRHPYYNNVWGGCWTIEEVVFAECRAEAEMHLGETVWYYDRYHDGVEYFDINFIESDEDRIFYHMPTTGELGLEGGYYLLIWDEDNEYPAAVVSSEHEIFLIKGNTVFRAVQEEEYVQALQGL